MTVGCTVEMAVVVGASLMPLRGSMNDHVVQRESEWVSLINRHVFEGSVRRTSKWWWCDSCVKRIRGMRRVWRISSLNVSVQRCDWRVSRSDSDIPIPLSWIHSSLIFFILCSYLPPTPFLYTRRTTFCDAHFIQHQRIKSTTSITSITSIISSATHFNEKKSTQEHSSPL